MLCHDAREEKGMMSILLKILEELIGGTRFLLPFFVLLLAVAGILAVHQRLWPMPKYLLLSAMAESCGLFGLAVLLMIENEGNQSNLPKAEQLAQWSLGLAILILMILILIAGGCAGKYIRIRKVLKSVLNDSQKESFEHNPIRAWRKLDELKPSQMTQGQKRQYERYRMYLRASLGNFNANERELMQMENGDRKQAAFFHFMRFFQYWSAGDMETAAEHIQKAEIMCDADTELLIRAQILINRGVGYVGLGLYKDADDAFTRAIRFCEKHKIRDKHLWTTIYYNYVFNQTRLKPDIAQEKWKAELEQLKTYLDMELPMDYLAYADVELELLRQTNADKSMLEENVYYTFDYLKMCHIPDHNRCMLEASMARIIWSARLNPTYILEALAEDLELLLKMPMPARYNCFKQIDLFFADLNGPIVNRHEKLKQSAYWYMTSQAAQDLEEYRRSLPSEAVYERCFCFEELAGIQKRREHEYQWDVVKENLENAMALYHENGLELKEIMCKLTLMDEASGIMNRDEQLHLLRKEEMEQLVKEVEALFPRIRQHPVKNEVALQLSFYCSTMDDYERCKRYYEIYRETGRLISMNHYAPWMHRYYMAVCFVVRTLYILETVKKLSDTEELPTENALVQEWFRDFGKGDGEREAFVLGRMLGFEKLVWLKRAAWKDDTTGQPVYHAWLVFGELKLEIDVTYPDLTEDSENTPIFFVMGRHPMENGDSRLIREKRRKNLLAEPAVQTGTFGLGNFSLEIQQAILEICQLLEQHLPPQCPSVEELKRTYCDVMLPVSADGKQIPLD